MHTLIPRALLSSFTSRSCFSAGQVNYSATATHNTTNADGTCGDGARREENSAIVDRIYPLSPVGGGGQVNPSIIRFITDLPLLIYSHLYLYLYSSLSLPIFLYCCTCCTPPLSLSPISTGTAAAYVVGPSGLPYPYNTWDGIVPPMTRDRPNAAVHR